MTTQSIRLFYDRWPQYNQRLRDVIAAMTDEQLAISPSPEGMPIWATVGHTAGMRVYWLCGVVGEPGADITPFADPMSIRCGLTSTGSIPTPSIATRCTATSSS